jgi:hypothetical protein
MPFDNIAAKIDLIYVAQRCVAEWLDHLSHLDPADERFSPALVAFREAIELRNRLERSVIPLEAEHV